MSAFAAAAARGGDQDHNYEDRDQEARNREGTWRRLLIGSSPAMERTVAIIRLVGARRATVLITGETGTGKEMVARSHTRPWPARARTFPWWR